MRTTQGNTIVQGAESMIGTYEKRERPFLIFFKTTWWEKVSERSLGNDIYITTNREIRNVYLNGELLQAKTK